MTSSGSARGLFKKDSILKLVNAKSFPAKSLALISGFVKSLNVYVSCISGINI